MLELSRQGELWRLGYGGDTLNTAVHLARLGCDAAYFTALGADPFSLDLKRQWQAEGLDVSLVLSHPGRQPGLYAIDTDSAGERRFTYWRDSSAAREMFALPAVDEAMGKAEWAGLLFFSLITLAILPADHRRYLLDLASLVRANGGRVAFDGNYRARLWGDAGEAARARDEAIAVADIGLPTLEDEAALSGAETARQVAEHWRALGCEEVVVKLGAQGCLLPDGTVSAPAEVLAPLDTSGAGDAFNAAYLAARLRGAPPEAAAREGHRLAGWTVMRQGAIPPRDAAAPYSALVSGGVS